MARDARRRLWRATLRPVDEHAEDEDNGASESDGPFHDAILAFDEAGFEAGNGDFEVELRCEVALPVADGVRDGFGLLAFDPGGFEVTGSREGVEESPGETKLDSGAGEWTRTTDLLSTNQSLNINNSLTQREFQLRTVMHSTFDSTLTAWTGRELPRLYRNNHGRVYSPSASGPASLNRPGAASRETPCRPNRSPSSSPRPHSER